MNAGAQHSRSAPQNARLWLLKLLALAAMAWGGVGRADILLQDNFNGALTPAWSIVRPDLNYYSCTATGLVLRCNSGDLYQGGNNARNVFVVSNTCTGDFKVTAKLRWLVPPATAYAQFALLAYDDDDNYVRAYYGQALGMLGCSLAAETGAAYAGTGSASLNAGTTEFWLRLLKRDFEYSMAYSLDGTNFTPVLPGASFQDGVPTRVGFVAMVDPSQTATVLVESFTLETVPVAGPAPGQRYQPLDLAGVVNGVNNWLLGYPTGSVELGGVPFNILPPTGNNIWNSSANTVLGVQSAQSMQLPVRLYGVTAADVLINTAWGNPGSTWVALSCQGSDGSSFTNWLTAGQDIRDWLQNVFENLLSSTNSSQVFSSSATSNPGKWGRIDKQHIVLPPSFASRVVTNIALLDIGVTGSDDGNYSQSVHAQRSYLQGLTVTLASPPQLNIAAEPATGAVLISWPTNYPGWTLQSTVTLAPSSWQEVGFGAGQPEVQGAHYRLTLPSASGDRQRFFRLSAPN